MRKALDRGDAAADVTLARRELLGLAGVAGVGVAVASFTVLAPPAQAQPKSTLPSMKTVYRRSPVGRTTCTACKGHDACRYYRTAAAAAKDKPHRGCDCAVISHKLPVNKWNEYFKHAGQDLTVWDTRWPKNAQQTKEAKR